MNGRHWNKLRNRSYSFHVLRDDAFFGTAIHTHSAGAFTLAHWSATRAGGEVAEHEHRDAHFMYIVSGSFQTGVAGSGPGAAPPLIYNPPRTVHRDRFASPRGTFFSVTFDPAAAGCIGSLPVVPTAVRRHAALSAMLRLIREISTPGAGESPAVAEELCTDLVTLTTTEEIDRPIQRWLAEARRELERDDEECRGIADLSGSLGVHRGHLIREFRKHHGATPAEFARARRLARAAHLLASTRMPLAEVALATGFADQSHFTRSFHRAYGLAPGKYRASLGR